jgi:hypothetical protein
MKNAADELETDFHKLIILAIFDIDFVREDL